MRLDKFMWSYIVPRYLTIFFQNLTSGEPKECICVNRNLRFPVLAIEAFLLKEDLDLTLTLISGMTKLIGLVAGRTLAGAKVIGEGGLPFRVTSLNRGSKGRFKHLDMIRCLRLLIFQVGSIWVRNHWSYGTVGESVLR